MIDRFEVAVDRLAGDVEGIGDLRNGVSTLAVGALLVIHLPGGGDLSGDELGFAPSGIGAVMAELVVDRTEHAREIARFLRRVVRRPDTDPANPAVMTCAIWTAAIGDDGYGR